MTDREKIIEIIKRNGTYNGRSLSFDYYVIQPDDLADALIAAGLKFDTVVSHTATFDLAQQEQINRLERDNAALRERLEKAEKEIDEYKRKIEYGKLVEPVWFISFMNDLPCYGRVIGYQEDSGFVMECSDCMISAKKIYLSEEDAEEELKGESKK